MIINYAMKDSKMLHTSPHMFFFQQVLSTIELVLNTRFSVMHNSLLWGATGQGIFFFHTSFQDDCNRCWLETMFVSVVVNCTQKLSL